MERGGARQHIPGLLPRYRTVACFGYASHCLMLVSDTTEYQRIVGSLLAVETSGSRGLS